MCPRSMKSSGNPPDSRTTEEKAAGFLKDLVSLSLFPFY